MSDDEEPPLCSRCAADRACLHGDVFVRVVRETQPCASCGEPTHNRRVDAHLDSECDGYEPL